MNIDDGHVAKWGDTEPSLWSAIKRRFGNLWKEPVHAIAPRMYSGGRGSENVIDLQEITEPRASSKRPPNKIRRERERERTEIYRPPPSQLR